ncbi:tRNA glutamyl-Q(34) synthetase GluQRS [Marinobacter sp. CHS3-4]|uniref:tRNA glutamyl-Q(34) synthetase GluQRS n=1 Tax=Marinobacter sp. CHS3-4 TaxID=3045174 RepID=UPI0024B5118C|nr:tRNA glutamyl-Q(34) synthetase GluQRS [Marinobacter sp. CHS3-4]MDI9246589.1 tRNA glutamyl-Q(34) synthetase GluQRS [Marinobacter sp. CHS3-4]
MPHPSYRGRFAPSPTGPLHMGSLVTALASFLDARANNGQWLVRIEDLDPLRETDEARDQILSSLEAHSLNSDEPIRFQSDCLDRYGKLVQQLIKEGKAYHCTCSRKQLKANGGRHPNRCRDVSPSITGGTPTAIRFALTDEWHTWTDNLQGNLTQHIHAEIDDPVIQRKEGFFSYQLAVVADDIDQNISHVVRGADMLEMTPQQCQIYDSLGAKPPQWMHIPLVTNQQGQKLSKQNHAPALDDTQASANLLTALGLLNQETADLHSDHSTNEILCRAAERWQPSRIHLTAR